MKYRNLVFGAARLGLTLSLMLATLNLARCHGQSIEIDATGPTKGTLVICGGGTLPDALRGKVIELSGGEHARIVVVATASQTADTPELESYVAWWHRQKLAELTILHTRSRVVADQEEFVEPLTRATGVWFLGGNQAWLIDTYSGTRTEVEFHKLLERGGVIGGTSAGAAVMSKLMIRKGHPNVELGRGFGFVDGVVIDQHFVRRQRQDRLLKVVEQYPHLVGLGIDEATALLIQGRRVSVLGDSEVRACFARTTLRDPMVESLRPGDQADLNSLSRIAAARLQPASEMAKVTPAVLNGTLVIVGDDATPLAATERFVEAAGGADATFAVMSLDSNEDDAAETEFLHELRRAGVKNVQHVQVSSRQQADDPKLSETLKAVGGIWLRGAKPQRFVESCLGTIAEKICRDVLQRGGAVGGSAAGGFVHGEILLNASPVPTKRMLIDGYDRGFGFLSGVAIMRSSQKGSTPSELTQLKHEHPQVVGLGIEESTAMIVHGHVMEVVGENQVAVFDGFSTELDRRPALLQAGDRYDFKDRSRLARKQTE